MTNPPGIPPSRIFLGALLLVACKGRGAPGAHDSAPTVAAPRTGAPPAPSATVAATPSITPAVASAALAAPSASPRACAPPVATRRLLWLEDGSRTALDHEALRCLSDAERAAVGLVAAQVSSQCDWDSSGGDPARHLDCPLTSGLGLGFQCEEKHRGYLLRWLGDALPPRCPRIPGTAYAQAVLDEVTLVTRGGKIVVQYRATGTHGPGEKTWTWSERFEFQEQTPGRLAMTAHKLDGKRF